jgi:CheY-like chemotaxis protein
MPRILIVDDEKDLIDILILLLQMHNFEIFSTDDGEETIDLVKKLKPDVVLLDASLKNGIDGKFISRSLKEDDETADVPVIVCSGYLMSDDFKRLCQADDYIAKPFDIEYLVEKITQFSHAPGVST